MLFFKRKKKEITASALLAHLIALARLAKIPAEELAKETFNNIENGKYLLKMVEIITKAVKKVEKKND